MNLLHHTPKPIHRILSYVSDCIKKCITVITDLYDLVKSDNINKKDLVSTILAALALFCFDFWTYFRNNEREVNWFIVKQPIETLPTVTWYLKELGIRFSFIFLSYIMYNLTRMRQWLRVVAECLIVYFVIELILFFVCFNRTSSVGTYFILLLVIARAVFLKVIVSNKKKPEISFDNDDTEEETVQPKHIGRHLIK